MFIGKMPDDGEGGEVGVKCDPNSEYRTATQIFDLMTNSHLDEEGAMTNGDLVLLYKNIDVNTKLTSDEQNQETDGSKNECSQRKSNQYVETVVYNGDSDSDSELSENYIDEDVNTICMINQESMDFFNETSLDNVLTKKMGGLAIKSCLSTEFCKKILHKDFMTTCLEDLNLLDGYSKCNNVLSTSLVDCIWWNGLEDNRAVEMDNIITYVQHTIDHLKRISNGDYLTDQAKEKWKEACSEDREKNTKVLVTSTSNPNHAERKLNGHLTWDDIVHSEIDVRTLSKILEKKLVFKIPKLIAGSYKLYSKRCAHNLVISCQKEERYTEIKEERKESRIDVVLKLQRSQTGQIMSNISSITVLQTSLSDTQPNNILSLPFKGKNEYSSTANDTKEPSITITELDKEADVSAEHEEKTPRVLEEMEPTIDEDLYNTDSPKSTNDYAYSEDGKIESFEVISTQYSSESSLKLRNVLDEPIFPLKNEAKFDLITPDELRITMQRLNMQSSVAEENGEDMPLITTTKRKSPLRVRIKSPYENKSFFLEEKKRKRLLEIRARREKKKLALSENCKAFKHKYGKGPLMPQASNSVTKLSITNKAFYNSIYGQSSNDENKTAKAKIRKEMKPIPDLTSSEPNQEEYIKSSIQIPERSNKNYNNNSYFQDDAEVRMHIDMKQNNDNAENLCLVPSSMVPYNFDGNNLLTRQHAPSETNITEDSSFIDEELSLEPEFGLLNTSIKNSKTSATIYTVPENSPTIATSTPSKDEPKTNVSGIECRKSIDKLYELMKTFSKPNVMPDIKFSKNKLVLNIEHNELVDGCSSATGSDSGTSLKHHFTTSNPGSVNSERNSGPVVKLKPITNKNYQVVPNVVITPKLQMAKTDVEKNKKERQKIISPHKGSPENPLKAISQLINEFDNINKSRTKHEVRPRKRTETQPIDGRNIIRQNSFRRRSRIDQASFMKENEIDNKIKINNTYKEKKFLKPLSPSELARTPHQQVVTGVPKRKTNDIIDEAREARGEAVRGPKLNPRLNSLAQPKRSYVQAHSEEYQNKYGRNILAHRLQRLAAAPPPTVERNVVSANARNRNRRFGDNTTMASVKQLASAGLQLDKYEKHRSASSSPTRKYQKLAVPADFKVTNRIAVAAMQNKETINKMVAVESYVKNHYGRFRGTSPSGEALLSGHKSRVPLLPTNIELSSLTPSPTEEEANEIGDTLHRVIDSMLINVSPLSTLSECDPDSNRQVSKSSFSYDRDLRRESDYCIDVLEDRDVQTAVANIDNEYDCSKTSVARSITNLNTLQRVNSRLEMEKLESALCNQISSSFQKRLRIKKLTLTPKHSIQQVFLVQSGDAGSLLVKSSLKANKRSMDSLHKMKAMPVLSKSHLDWRLAQIPMQIMTVGYGFPENKLQCSGSTVKLVEVSNITKTDQIEDSKVSNSHEINEINVPRRTLLNSKEEDTMDCESSLSGILDLKSHEKHVIPDKNKESSIEISRKDSNDHASNIIIEEEMKQTARKCHVESDQQAFDTDHNCNRKYNADNVKDPIDAKNSTIACNADVNENPKTLTPIPDNVDYTSSLDVLVDLLNEIQKITGQDQVIAEGLGKSETHPMKMISCDKLKSCCNIKSTTNPPEVGKSEVIENGMRQADDTEKVRDESVETEAIKLDYVDKEVSANMIQKECVNSFTSAPGSLMALKVSHSANAKNSDLSIISGPNSIITLSDYQTIYSNSVFNTHSITEFIKKPLFGIHSITALIPNTELTSIQSFRITGETKMKNIDKGRGDDGFERRNRVNKIDLDPMLKSKRDILVAFYSVFVLTIFAALSFSEFIV